MSKIPFNKPYLSGNETQYIEQAVASGKISGDGKFTKKCQAFFEERYGFRQCLLTTSCTDALEMAALLLDIQPGDEVIMPSYTFVSTANAFVLRGARIVFADSSPQHPNMDISTLPKLINSRTKAIVVVHYAGMACDMDALEELAAKYKLFLVEDAAQAIESFHLGRKGRRPLGSIGHLAAFSFHETKNIISGEGGMLVINDARLSKRAEIIREKGTNRSAFFRGEVDKYNWIDIGSSFLPSDIIAAFLYAQLENLERIQARRLALWQYYYEALSPLAKTGQLHLPHCPPHASNNGHLFYLLPKETAQQEALLCAFEVAGINAVFHYLPLHRSPFYINKHDGRELPLADYYAARLIRLPLFYELRHSEQDEVVQVVVKELG